MKRRAVIAAAGIVAIGVAGVSPALAKSKPKPIKGTWSFTDFTPDPTVTVLGTAKGADPYCHGTLPEGPADSTTQQLKIAGKGLLTVTGTNTGDWAMEVDDAKGNLLAGSDGSSPQDQEGLALPLTKAGTYTVHFCNLTGAPTATAKYSFVYR
jgi:hypothetical protein